LRGSQLQPQLQPRLRLLRMRRIAWQTLPSERVSALTYKSFVTVRNGLAGNVPSPLRAAQKLLREKHPVTKL
jgi:hypothetical protein